MAGYDQRLRCEPLRATLRKRADTLDLYESLPRWQGPGEAGAGEVAIWAEQGIGDQILFSTLIPELIARGVPFVYEVDRRLLAVPTSGRFQTSALSRSHDPPLSRIAAGKPGAAWPVRCRGCSGARAGFRAAAGEAAQALPERVAHYRQRLAALGPGLKVALSWRSTREDWFVRKKKRPFGRISRPC